MITITELENVDANYFELSDSNKTLYVFKVDDHYEFSINEGYDDDQVLIDECIEFCKQNSLNYEVTDSNILIRL
jgi:hypothetical protein